MKEKNAEHSREDVTDLCMLWETALDDYRTTTKLDMSKKLYRSVEDIMDDKDIQTRFLKFRHNDGKVDKLRKLIYKSTDLILAGTSCIATAAAVAFPPSAILLTAFTYVMKASQDVSKDYDKITAFFDVMESFLQQVKVIEGKLPKEKSYTAHMLRVFAALLKACGLASKATKEGRLKLYGKKLLYGGLGAELQDAEDHLNNALEQLKSATGFANLGLAVENQRGIQEVKDGLGIVGEVVEEIRQDTGHINSNLREVAEATSDIAAGLNESNERWKSYQEDDAQFRVQLSTKIDQLLDMQKMSAPKETESEALQKQDIAHRKQTAFSIVKRAFAPLEDPQLRDREFEHAWAENTTDWFTSMPQFVSWMKERSAVDNPFLWINGEEGVGKSWLAYAAVQALRRWTASHSTYSVVHVYFRHDSLEQGALRELIKCAVTQISRLDRTYCEHIAAELKRAHGQVVWSSPNATWRKYVTFRYQIDSDDESSDQLYSGDETRDKLQSDAGPRGQLDSRPRLYLVLDGLDELPQSPIPLFNAIKCITSENLNIRVLLFARPQLKAYIPILGQRMQSFKIEKKDIEEDMHRLVNARLKSSSRLRKLREGVKRSITKTLVDRAPNMLYIDNMIRRLNSVQGERAVVKCLREAPNSMEELYTTLIDEIKTKRTHAQLKNLRIFFAWLTYSHHRVTINEIEDVMRLCGQESLFSAEDEIQGRSLRVLEVVSATNSVDDYATEEISDDEVSEDKGQVEHDSRDDTILSLEQTGVDDSIVRFYSRTMRDFFRSEETKEDEIRISPTAAHLMFFEMCLKIIGGQYMGQLNPSLRKYAAGEWARHFRDVTENVHLVADDDVPRVTACLRSLLQNELGAASFFEIEYDPAHHRSLYSDSMVYKKRDQESLYLRPFQKWAKRVLTCPTLGADEKSMREWAATLCVKSSEILVELAKAHVKNWFTEPGREQISYKCAVGALNMTDLLTKEYKNKEGNPARKIRQVARLFDDVPLDAAAHRAIAEVLHKFDHNDEAEEECQESLRKSEDDIERLKTMVLLAHLQRSMPQIQGNNNGTGKITVKDSMYMQKTCNGAYERSHKTIEQALAVASFLNDLDDERLIRRALVLRADCEMRLGLFEKAVCSIQEARLSHPYLQMEGDALALLPLSIASTGRYEQLLDKIRDWSFFEYMAWLIYDFDSSGHRDPNLIFQHAAKVSDNEAFAIKRYQQIIACLEPRGAAGYMQIHLGSFYYHVMLDTDKAKDTWLQALHRDMHIDPCTGDQDDKTATAARLGLADAIYNQFRASPDPARKAVLLGELEQLQEIQRGEPAQKKYMAETATAIIHANMVRRVRSAKEYQDTLCNAFDTCITGLTDSEGWNDQASLLLLAQVLASVGGLDREAQIAYSAQFSLLDPRSSHQGGEDATDVVDPTATTEWGDIAPQTGFRCCGDEKTLENWSDGPIYLCLVCSNVQLCQECYERIHAHRNGAEWQYWKRYCGVHHRYIKGPASGWKGIRDGYMVIGGEKTKFADWLADLCDEKWNKAWEEFWVREEGMQDIL